MKKEWKNEVKSVGYLAIIMLLLLGSLPLYGVFAEENVSDVIVENTEPITFEDTSEQGEDSFIEQSIAMESEVIQSEILTEITNQETSTEETIKDDNPLFLDSYLLSGNETITISRTDGSVINQGKRFCREYFVTLDNYHDCEQNIQGNHLLQASYNVYGNGEILQSGVLMLGSVGGDSFTIEYAQTGEYTIEILASGYVENEEEYIWISDKVVSTVTDSVEKITLQMQADIEKDGHFSYREDYGRSVALSFFVEGMQVEETGNICYSVSSSNEAVIKPVGEQEYDSISGQNTTFLITGAGQAELTIEPMEYDFYEIHTLVIPIEVENSPMKDIDYHITYTDTEETEMLFSGTFKAWQEFLQQKKYWLNGSISISLSEEGEQYYTGIGTQVNQGDSVIAEEKQFAILSETPMQQYDFWCSNLQNNTTTKTTEHGIRSFTVGIDRTAPKNKEITYNDNAYETTSTTLTRYYGESVHIHGSFEDTLSGVGSIEYTTQADLGNYAEWKPIPDIIKNDVRAEYELVLEQGIYTGIAVRAIDVAGNVSECIGLQSESGEYIKFIVDKTEPIPLLMSKTSDEISYQGKWTNQPITIAVTESPEYKTLAGIQTMQYQYVSIGGEYQPEQWEEVPKNGMIEIINDQNGTYYFRAISNTGIMTSVQTQKDNAFRIRLQQTIAEKQNMIETAPELEQDQVWYNKKSGVPTIEFTYPEYDNGVKSLEYDAPITIHRRLTAKLANEKEMTPIYKTATIGVLNDEVYQKLCVGESQIIEEQLEELTIDFSYDKHTGYATDGIYQLEYWISDAAGNESEHDVYTYQIDTHEPERLEILVDNIPMEQDTSQTIQFDRFYQSAVSGSASADFGISGKGIMKLMVAESIGDWENNTNWIQSDSFSLSPCTSGCIYMIAEDAAGNQSILRTQGIVVDNQPPKGENGGKFITITTKANESQFYNQDVEVKLSASDFPQNRGFSALESFVCVIGTTGKEGDTQKEIFSCTKALPSKEELAATRRVISTEVIDSTVYEGNDTYVEIIAKDRCGNIATSREVLKIDVTSPKVEITFDHNEAKNGNFYQTIRTATIHVQELNMNKQGLEIQITRDGVAHSIPNSEWQSDGEQHWTTICFMEDGDYTMTISCTDLADNTSEEVSVEPFTIDLTKPEITITYDNNTAMNEMYFQSARTASITVKEHNFKEMDFIMNAEPQLLLSNWRHEGDMHYAQIDFGEDNHYRYQCSYTDLAGNEADIITEQEFYIDSIAPQLVIQGVENESANAGEISPVVTIYDTNYNKEGVEITVTTGQGDLIPLEIREEEIEQGYSYRLTDLSQNEDNIYYLQVTAWDMAGNQNELRYRFSLNRNGSTYDLTQISQITKNVYNRSDQLSDISIIEMNVDEIEDYSIYMTRNGKMLTCRETQERPQIDSNHNEICYYTEMTGDEKTGYSNRYIFYQENFAQEGIYRITCYSKDQAGNEMNNTLEEKSAEVSFVIDNTAPKVVIDGIEEGGIYNEESQTVHIMVQDNFLLEKARFTLVNQEGEELQSWDYMELAKKSGDTVAITIPSLEARQFLLYQVSDAAGNELVLLSQSEDTPKGFLITTNPWLRFISSPIKVAGGIFVCIAMFLMCLFYTKRNKN